jgi:hypothetical protein
MHCLETITKMNRAEKREVHPLYWHPRIAALRRSVNRLPVGDDYRCRLRHALYQYADQIVTRSHYKSEEGWDDLEALQQVTLGDWMEVSIRRYAEDDRRK